MNPRAILPALYLASSWTWVIGMYFPFYLLADFGLPGWVAFAVPNVIGAAAMGVVLRSRESSERFIVAHSRALWWFSAITIAFHISVLTWLLANVAAEAGFPALAVVGPLASAMLTAVALVAARLNFRASLIAAASVYVFSLACALLAGLTAEHPAFALPSLHGSRSTLDLLCITPVLLFGFALCPYLDLTFHRIRREFDDPKGRVAFILGFGVFFLAMIVMSLFYASAMLKGWANWWIIAHICAQSVFTMSIHFREQWLVRGNRQSTVCSRESASPDSRWPTADSRPLSPFFLSPMLIVVILAALGLGALPLVRANLDRTTYEVFMSFYGMTFPAYIWIAVVARRLAPRSRFITWCVSVLLGLPLLWFGWTEHHYPLVPFAIVIPIAAPFVARRMNKTK